MACSSGCRTKDHRSYGECLKDKGDVRMSIGPTTGTDRTTELRFQAETDAYAAAVKEGLDPAACTWDAVNAARKAADEAGAPVRMS